MTLIARVVLVLSLLVGLPSLAAEDADEAAEERRLNDLAFDLMIEGQTRVMGVADRIRIAGADLCGG